MKLANLLHKEFDLHEDYELPIIDPNNQSFILEEGKKNVLFFSYQTFRKYCPTQSQLLTDLKDKSQYNKEREIQIIIKTKKGKLYEGIVVKIEPIPSIIC